MGKKHERLSGTGIRPAKPITPKEIAHRHEIVAAPLRLKREIGPIAIPADELIRAVRIEEESKHA